LCFPLCRVVRVLKRDVVTTRREDRKFLRSIGIFALFTYNFDLFTYHRETQYFAPVSVVSGTGSRAHAFSLVLTARQTSGRTIAIPNPQNTSTRPRSRTQRDREGQERHRAVCLLRSSAIARRLE